MPRSLKLNILMLADAGPRLFAFLRPQVCKPELFHMCGNFSRIRMHILLAKLVG
jgi:hypothetical protein